MREAAAVGIAKERQILPSPCHGPSRLPVPKLGWRRMSVIHSERRLNERMSATGTGVQKRNVAWIGIVGVSVVRPASSSTHCACSATGKPSKKSAVMVGQPAGRARRPVGGRPERADCRSACATTATVSSRKLQSIRSHCDAVVWCGRDERASVIIGSSQTSQTVATSTPGNLPGGLRQRARNPASVMSGDTLHKVRVLRTARDDFTIFFSRSGVSSVRSCSTFLRGFRYPWLSQTPSLALQRHRELEHLRCEEASRPLASKLSFSRRSSTRERTSR